MGNHPKSPQRLTGNAGFFLKASPRETLINSSRRRNLRILAHCCVANARARCSPATTVLVLPKHCIQNRKSCLAARINPRFLRLNFVAEKTCLICIKTQAKFHIANVTFRNKRRYKKTSFLLRLFASGTRFAFYWPFQPLSPRNFTCPPTTSK